MALAAMSGKVSSASRCYMILYSALMATPQNLPDTGFRYDPLSGLRATDREIRITVDTAGSGDKFSQAIAESIQIATRSGYSTTPAGFL
jgi:hypothetical protein